MRVCKLHCRKVTGLIHVMFSDADLPIAKVSTHKKQLIDVALTGTF
jgi:hypothetical protein